MNDHEHFYVRATTLDGEPVFVCRECTNRKRCWEGELRVIGPLEKMMESMREAALRPQMLFMARRDWEDIQKDDNFTK
jgi:hypothetical protein